MIFDPPGRPQSLISLNARFDRALVRRVVATVGVGLLFAGASSTAFAAPGETDTGTTTANIEVQSSITLTALTPDFTLTGLPGATVDGDGIVTMNVETNNVAGYAVTVLSSTATLDPADTATNTDTIPIGALSVREAGETVYTPLSETTPVTVHTQAERSESGGDTVTNDYQVVIPFVNADLYSTVLNYVATTL